MKYKDSINCVLSLARALSIDELPLNNRTDKWWDSFWERFGLEEAKRISRSIKSRAGVRRL